VRLPFEFFLALRLLRPRRSYVSVITILSLLGVLAGVMALIVVLSVMDGFQKELREKIIGFNPHLELRNQSLLRPDPHVDEILKSDPDVTGFSPFVMGPVLVEFNGRFDTPTIRGLDEDTIESVLPLKNTIKVGEWSLGPDSIMVGFEWAKSFGAQIGDKIYIYGPRNLQHLQQQRDKSGKANQSYFAPSEYIIAGMFSSGYYEYDLNFFLVSLPEAQKIYNVGDQLHGISIRTKDPMRAKEIKERLNRKLEPPTEVVSWMDMNRHLVGAVAVEKVVMFILLLLIIVVAAIGLMSTLITVTVQKTKEIGLLKALGARDRQIVAVFTLYGFLVGLLGSIFGVIAGLSLLFWRNEFRDFLGRYMGLELFPAEIYNLAQIPAVIDYNTVVLIAACGIVLSTAAAFIPAWSAARLDAARSLHAE
jgi:lipoprotein-releasing system permease protein